MRYLFVLHVHARNVDVFATRHKFLGILREVLQNDITILKMLHAHTKYYVWDFFAVVNWGTTHVCVKPAIATSGRWIEISIF
jgi:hypothetical protein